jgi:hypothetical protein
MNSIAFLYRRMCSSVNKQRLLEAIGLLNKRLGDVADV